MTQGVRTIIYPVRDLARAKALFAAIIGAPPTSDAPYYVGFSVAGQDIGLDPNGHSQGMTGPVGYFHVDDIRATLAQLVAAGAEEQNAVRDVGGGRLIATAKDGDGNVIGLLQG